MTRVIALLAAFVAGYIIAANRPRPESEPTRWAWRDLERVDSV